MINKTLLEEQEPILDRLILSPKKIVGVTAQDLQSIVEDSFGVAVSDDYIPDLMQNNADVYFRFDRKKDEVIIVGAAVVIPKPEEDVPPHLMTLAVPAVYQNQGIGKEIMAELLRYYPKLNWRSKPQREVANKIYHEITRDVVFFTATGDISYKGYFVNHTLKEKQLAMMYMENQPSHFKK